MPYSDVNFFQMFIIQISTVFDFSSGLEYLSRIDGLFVKQLVEVLEIVTGFETENKFHILNKNGQTVYKVTRIRISNWKTRMGEPEIFFCEPGKYG